MAELTSTSSPDVLGTKAGSNSCKSEPTLDSAGTSPNISQNLLEFKNLVYVRYYDHVLFHRSSAIVMAPLVREAVGWLIYECEQYVTIVCDRDARPPTLKGNSDPKATGIVILRSDLAEFKRLVDLVPPKISFENSLNCQNATRKNRVGASSHRSEKLSKKSRGVKKL